jgi:hypothetical protein
VGRERACDFRAFPLPLAGPAHGLLRFFPSPVQGLFLPLFFLGTASGEFLRPAASRLLLSRFLPRITRVPPGMQPLALGAAALAFGCLRKMGQKKEKHMYLYVKWNSFGLRFARRRF